MDSIAYNNISNSEPERTSSKNEVFLCGSRRIKASSLLYGTLLVLLLILLLVTGIKFSQLGKEMTDVKLYLASINSSMASAQAKGEQGNKEKLIGNVHVAPERGSCEEGWLFFQDNCYYKSETKLSWAKAEQECIEKAAHLLVINSHDEQEYITKTFPRLSYWIGLVERGEEGHWEWVDGSDYATTPHYWDRGQPDDWFMRVNGEDCGQIHVTAQEKGLWNDADCTHVFQYICEQMRK